MRSRVEEITGDPGAIELANLFRRGNVQDTSNHHELPTFRGDEGEFGISRSGSLSSAIDHFKSRFDSSPTFYHHTPPARRRPGFLKRRNGTLQDSTGISSPYTHEQRAKTGRRKLSTESLPPIASRTGEAEVRWSRSADCNRPCVPGDRFRHGARSRNKSPVPDLESGLVFDPPSGLSVESFPRFEDDDIENGERQEIRKAKKPEVNLHNLPHDHKAFEGINESAAKQARDFDTLFIIFLIILGIVALVQSATGKPPGMTTDVVVLLKHCEVVNETVVG